MDLEAFDRQLEAVDRELNAFIEKRAKGREAANRAEESWKAPTRQRHQQRQRENALAWADHYQSMARVPFGLDRRVIARHAKRCLVGERRGKLVGKLWAMAEATAPAAVEAYRAREAGGAA